MFPRRRYPAQRLQQFVSLLLLQVESLTARLAKSDSQLQQAVQITVEQVSLPVMICNHTVCQSA